MVFENDGNRSAGMGLESCDGEILDRVLKSLYSRLNEHGSRKADGCGVLLHAVPALRVSAFRTQKIPHQAALQ